MLLLLAALLSTAHARPEVVIVRSDSFPAYDLPVETFRSALGKPTRMFDIKGDRDVADRVFRDLAADPPPLVFAVGAKAAFMAVQALPDVPVIHALVGEPARYGIRGTHVTGVSMRVAPDAVVAEFRRYAPEVARIGVLLAVTNMGEATKQSLDAARTAGLTVKVERVTNDRDLRVAWRRLAGEVDAVWLLADPVASTPDNFFFLLDQARRSRIPMFAGSEVLVRAGALMSVEADSVSAGEQAADLARQVLEDGAIAGSIPMPDPLGVRVVFNRDAMTRIGLSVEPGVLELAEVVGGDDASR